MSNEQTDLMEPLRSLLDTIPQSSSDAIIAADRDGLVRYWNPGATWIFGFGAAEATNRSLDLIIPEKHRARHWQGFHHAVATGRSRYGEGEVLSVPAVTKHGGRVSVEFMIRMLRDGGGTVVGMVAILRDVTKRFEELTL